MGKREAVVAVIGAGPAGICSVAALVSKGISVKWVDPKHRSGVGRLSKFSNVHANTKINLLSNWFKSGYLYPYVSATSDGIAALAAIKGTAKPLAFASDHAAAKRLYGVHENWCKLGAVVNVFDAIATTLRDHSLVHTVDGFATRLQRANEQLPWTVEVASKSDHTAGAVADEYTCDAVVLAVGAEPNAIPGLMDQLGELEGGPRLLSAEVAVDRDQLEKSVKPGERVALIGTSHTAGLVAMHLHEMGWGHEDLTVFGRSEARNAVWTEPGQYLYSATGLKGAAAAFVDHQRRNAPDSPLLAMTHASQLSRSTLNTFDVVIPAIGYTTSALPAVVFGGEECSVDPRSRVASTSQLALQRCENSFLYGVGVGWPDYFAKPEEPGRVSLPGFGGPQDERAGLVGEQYVGFNGMMMRAESIANKQLWLKPQSSKL